MHEKHFISTWQMWSPQAEEQKLPTAELKHRSLSLSLAVCPPASSGALLRLFLAVLAAIIAEGRSVKGS